MFFSTLILLGGFTFYNPMMGSRNPADIPIPKNNFVVLIVDSEDNRLELSSFSCDGEVYIKGMIGKAQSVISFDKINSISFSLLDSELIGKLTLKDGKEVSLKIKKTLQFYGKTDYGNFIIRAEDIKSITFK